MQSIPRELGHSAILTDFAAGINQWSDNAVAAACRGGDIGGMVDALDEGKPTKAKPRWRWQFSLRSALLLMLALGAGLGIWARYERVRRNRWAILEKHEGE